MYESLNHAELATCVLGLGILSLVLAFATIYVLSTIISFRQRFDNHANSLFQETKTRRSEDAEMAKDILELSAQVDSIKRELCRPLYEVGNKVWYNRGVAERGGIHLDYEGTIIDIVRNPNAQPDYIVNGSEGNRVYVSQRIITAWTN